ncbi:PilZ domain-containing protein [Thiomicrospira microaerophila]|uniref:PilZ domain-containing protein n=1 Tax=Thiomicrospira microaerophila TaxID=406020 RepID=UPI002010210C|nr:PilZ domain-containing protein [Thiomicrospira microaerophila]UQB41729.1 PilZ domain-containing protein [Thiomicrospira microaerophila]
MQNSMRNVRRFFRINMPLRAYVTPRSPITDRDILATGANYYPDSVANQINHQKVIVNSALNKVQDSKEAIMAIFSEILDHLEFYEECLLELSRGYNPKKDTSKLFKLNSHLEGLPKLNLLKTSSPKTYTYLKLIEEKYIYFLQRLDEVLTHSDPNNFYAPTPIPVGFKLDEFCAKLSDEKYNAIPLLQAIIQTSQLLNIYTEMFRNLHNDHSQRQHPELWESEPANVSASGLALKLRKGLKLNERLDVLIYFKDDERLLLFEGIVVNIQSDAESFYERVAMNFEFPNGRDQTYLLAQIQKYELSECF